MKVHFYNFITLLVLLFVAVSCDYKSKDRFFRDLDPNAKPPAINLNINTLSDTVYLPKDQLPTFNITTGIERRQWMVVYLNDVIRDTIQNSTGKFTISLGNSVFSPGIYKLKIRVYLSTGTGSIGDKLDAEHFLYERVWWLMVSDNPSLGGVITGAVPENGNLKVSWTPYKGLGFGSYVLLRTLKGEWDYDTVAVVNDLTHTWVYDTTYVGEESTYVLKVYTGSPPYEYYDLVATSTYDYYYGFPELTLQPWNEKDLRLSWGRSVFLKHISKYKIMIREEYNEDSPTYIDIPNTDTTSYILANPKFTFLYEFTVTFSPFKTISQGYQGNFSRIISGYPGTPSFSCNEIYTPVGPYILFLNAGRIYKYDVADNQVTDSLVSPGSYAYQSFSVSPNGKYLTAPSSSGFILFYNIETHGSEFINFSEISPSSGSFSTTDIADNGIGVASDYYNLFLYDFIHHQLLNQATPTGQFWMNSISVDAQYIYLQNNYKNYCYRFTASSFTKVWDDPGNQYKRFYFDARDPAKVILFSGNTLFIVNISDWVPQVTLPLAADNLINVDFGAGKVLGYTSNYLRIFSLETGAEQAELPTIGTRLHGIQIKDNYLYSMEGYKLKVF